MTIGTANNNKQTQANSKFTSATQWKNALNSVNKLKSNNSVDRLGGIADIAKLISAIFA